MIWILVRKSAQGRGPQKTTSPWELLEFWLPNQLFGSVLFCEGCDACLGFEDGFAVKDGTESVAAKCTPSHFFCQLTDDYTCCPMCRTFENINQNYDQSHWLKAAVQTWVFETFQSQIFTVSPICNGCAASHYKHSARRCRGNQNTCQFCPLCSSNNRKLSYSYFKLQTNLCDQVDLWQGYKRNVGCGIFYFCFFIFCIHKRYDCWFFIWEYNFACNLGQD